MSLSDSRSRTAGVIHSPAGSALTDPCGNGPPRFLTDLSTRAVLNHPGEPDDCQRPLLHRRLQASAVFEDWPLPSSIEAESGLRTLGSRVRLAGLRQRRLLALTPARLHVERAIYTMTSLQVIRSARLSWRTKTNPFPRGPATVTREMLHALNTLQIFARVRALSWNRLSPGRFRVRR